VGQLLDQIRGKSLYQAEQILANIPMKATELVHDAIRSAGAQRWPPGKCSIQSMRPLELQRLVGVAAGKGPGAVKALDARRLMEGEKGARMKIVKMELPPPKAPGRIITGEPKDSARELARLLREERKLL